MQILSMVINTERSAVQMLERLAVSLRGPSTTAPHLRVGEEGEREALFELRRRGYIAVARRWRSPKLRGDLDIIAWDGDWLCFIEVKTRSERDRMSPAEAAVDAEKQKKLRRMARAYLRSFPEERRRDIPVRFDVVAVYLGSPRSEFEIFQGAFGWSS